MSTTAVELSTAEALVLFEFLRRFETNGSLDIEHPSETATLWKLLAVLETQLVEPLRPDYAGLLATARASVARLAGL
jgi:hypothetical protein